MAKKTSPRAKKTTRNKGTTPAPLSFKQRIAQFNLKEYLKGDTVKFLVGFLMLAISFFMLLSSLAEMIDQLPVWISGRLFSSVLLWLFVALLICLDILDCE